MKTGFQEQTMAVPLDPEQTSLRRRAIVRRLWGGRGLLLCLWDAVTLLLCSAAAFRITADNAAIAQLPTPACWRGAILFAFVWLLHLIVVGGYRTGLRSSGGLIFRLRRTLTCGLNAVVVLVTVSFLTPELAGYRVLFPTAAAMTMVVMAMTRVLLRAAHVKLAAWFAYSPRVLIVGVNEAAEDLSRRLQAERGAVEVLGFVAFDGDEHSAPEGLGRLPVFGHAAALPAIYAQSPFDELLFAFSAWPDAAHPKQRQLMIEIVNFCEARGISLYLVPDSFDVAVAQRELGTIFGLPLVRLRDASLHPGYRLIKRLTDIAVAATVLVVGAPLWLLIALAIRLTSRGPIIYVQERAGLNGRPFRMYKFRSMIADADQHLANLVDFSGLDEPVFHIDAGGDPRVTTVGRWLRRTSLDEIPQLWNVLRGEMSLVGPRPECVELVAKYDAWQRRRLKANPGITGCQQVFCRGDRSLTRRIKYDLIYLKHQSLLLDLYILLLTVLVVLRGEDSE